MLCRGAWEIGFQGGIFVVFNLAARSSDLINADHLGGITFTYALDSLAFITRFMHQSSHLGDEFLVNTEVERINLSFEELSEAPRSVLGEPMTVGLGYGPVTNQVASWIQIAPQSKLVRSVPPTTKTGAPQSLRQSRVD